MAGRPPKIERNQKIIELRAQGYTFRKLAEIFNLDAKTIYDIWKRQTKSKKQSTVKT